MQEKQIKKYFLLISFMLISFLLVCHKTVKAEVLYYGYEDTQRYGTEFDAEYKHSYYVQPTDFSENPEMVFCFNATQAPPTSITEGISTLYNKVIADSSNFSKYVTKPYYTSSAHMDWNRKYILGIIWNAYYNPSFNKQGLSEANLRKVVQLAIWYYTDSYSYTGGYLGISSLSTNEKNVYDTLINYWDANIDQKLQLELYIAQDGSHQNLLGTRILNPKVTVKFQKQDADYPEKLLDGAVFKIISGEGYKGNIQSYTTSSENPTISLYPGVYRIMEVTPPVGYNLDKTSSKTGQVVLVSPDGTVSLRGFDQNWNQVWTNLDNNTIVFTNKKASANLTLSKTVNGNAADKEKEFTFNITLTMSDGSPFSGQVTTEGNNRSGGNVTFSNGQATITLKDGENIAFQGLDSSATYSVQEVDADDYQTLISIDGGNQQAAKDYTGSLASDTSIVFTNTKDVVPPTGVTLNVKPYLLLVLMTLLIGGCGYYIKRKTRS